MEGVLVRVETATGVARMPFESPSEYVRRVADRTGVDPDLTDRTVAELEGAARRPGIDPNDRVIEAFLDRLADSDPGGSDSGDRTAGPDGLEAAVADLATRVERFDLPTGRGGTSVVSLPKRLRSSRRITTADGVFVAALFALGVLAFFRNLGQRSLSPADEGIYANAAKHMVTEGYWLIPHTNGFFAYGPGYQPFLEKPPLVMWLQGLSMKVVGAHELGSRFQSATFAILTGVLIYVATRELVDRRAGFLAGVVYMSSPKVVFGPNGATSGGTDMAVIFFGSLMTYLVWRGVREDDPRWLVYASLPATGAVMSKGFDAGVWVFVVVPLLLLRPWLLFSRDMAKAVGIISAFCLPWPVYAWHRYGYEFVEIIFFEQVVDRASSSPAVPAVFGFMKYPYIRDFPIDFDPWIYLFVPGVAFLLGYHWWSGRRSETGSVVFLLWWFVCIFGFYVRFGTTLTYTLKALVPAAILVGWFLREVADGRRFSRVAVASGGVSMLAFSIRMDGVSPVSYSSPTTRLLQRAWDQPLAGPEFVAVAVVSLLVLAYHQQLIRVVGAVLDRAGDRPSVRLSRVARMVVSAALVVGVVVVLLGTPGIQAPYTSPYEKLGSAIDEETPEDATIYVTGEAEAAEASNFAAVGFYSDRDLAGGHYRDWNLSESEDPVASDVRYLIATQEDFTNNSLSYGIDVSRHDAVIVYTARYGLREEGTEIVLVEVLSPPERPR